MKYFKQNNPLDLAAYARVAIYSIVSFACAACNSLPKTVSVDFPESALAKPVAVAPSAATPATGSLFQNASYRPGFEDPRARLVGDMITIDIKEKVEATQESSSTANRTTKNSANVSAMPLLSAADLARLNAGVSAKSENDFSGEGATASNNEFSGTITTTVVEVLPNGHLKVAGDKQIGVNQNVDVMRFTGTIDPRLIKPGNTISSNQVANVRVESRGRGAQAEAQTVGWLTRFFFSFLPF